MPESRRSQTGSASFSEFLSQSAGWFSVPDRRAAMTTPSGTHILPHHTGVLVFENVTVVHEGMFPHRGVIEGNQKFGLILDQRHVLPPRQMGGRWRARERQDAKRRAVHVERMSHADRDDFPDFQRSKPALNVNAGQVMGLSVDAQAREHSHLRRPLTSADPAVEYELAAADSAI